MKEVFNVYYVLFVLFCPNCSDQARPGYNTDLTVSKTKDVVMDNHQLNLTDWQWKKKLTPIQYDILRKKGTERPFTGKYYLRPQKDGTYLCAGCGAVIFKTDTQFDSHCGWPSFSAAEPNSILESRDTSHGMIRTEVTCARCGGHLGHVFDDGPGPSGLRYCINSAAMNLKEDKK